MNQNSNRSLRQRLSQRNLQPELMDAPDLPKDQHNHALRGLTTIHRFSGLVNRFWVALLPMLKQSQLKQSQLKQSQPNESSRLRIADVGCGDGYLLRQLSSKAVAEGFDVDWIGYDFSATACELAAAKATAAGATIRFDQVDILTSDLPEKVDVVLNSLFLHHFEAAEVQTILKKFRDASTQAFIVEDLRRTVLGYCLAWSCGRLLSRSPIVHYDSVVSVEGAFSIGEMQQILAAADLHHTDISKRWPERFVLFYRHG